MVFAEVTDVCRLRYIEVSDVKADIWKQLIHHRNKWMSRALKAVIDYMSECIFGVK